MNSRARRTQERADARRIANTRRALAEKARRDRRHAEKVKTDGS